MNKDEWNVIALTLKACYSNANFLADKEQSLVWFTMLQDLEYSRLKNAVISYTCKNHFPPAISDIRTEYAQLGIGNDWSKAWKNVLKAIRKHGNYGYKDAIKELSTTERECVDRLGWTTLCYTDNIGVERANFRQIYEALKKRETEEMLLPSNIKQIGG